MFESCRAHLRVSRTRQKIGVVRDLRAYVAERDAVRCAGDAPDSLVVVHELVTRRHVALDVEHPQAPVDLAAVVLARDRLLARVAPLVEVDMRLFEPGLRR